MESAPTGPNVTTFTVEDASGTPHTYTTQAHGPTEGLQIMDFLIVAGAEPLAALLMKGDEADASVIGTAIKNIIVHPNYVAIRHLLLKYTWREGVKIFGAEGCFETAYQKNYMEFYTALWKVVEANGFFPQFSTLVGKGAKKD